MKRIVGIDPGIVQTAAVIIDIEFETNNCRVIDYIAPTPPEENWLLDAHNVAIEITHFLDKHNKQFSVAIEQPIIRVFGKRNYQAIVNQFMFVGAFIHSFTFSYPHSMDRIYVVNPGTAKLALTGKGNAKKPEMVNAACKYNMEFLMSMTKAERESIADALGIALAVGKKLNGVERLC